MWANREAADFGEGNWGHFKSAQPRGVCMQRWWSLRECDLTFWVVAVVVGISLPARVVPVIIQQWLWLAGRCVLGSFLLIRWPQWENSSSYWLRSVSATGGAVNVSISSCCFSPVKLGSVWLSTSLYQNPSEQSFPASWAQDEVMVPELTWEQLWRRVWSGLRAAVCWLFFPREAECFLVLEC